MATLFKVGGGAAPKPTALLQVTVDTGSVVTATLGDVSTTLVEEPAGGVSTPASSRISDCTQ